MDQYRVSEFEAPRAEVSRLQGQAQLVSAQERAALGAVGVPTHGRGVEIDGEDGLVRNLDMRPVQLIEEKEAGDDHGDHGDAEQRQQPENEPHDKTEKTHCTDPSFCCPSFSVALGGAPS